MSEVSLKSAGPSFWENLKKELSPRIREWKYTLHLIRQSPLTILGLGIIIAAFVIAAIAPYIAPYGPRDFVFTDRFLPPSPEHPFGTDKWGGDIYSRILYAIRLDLQLSLMVVGISILIGVIIGTIAGFSGGLIDEALMRATDVILAFPGLILAMAIATALGNSIENVLLALSIVWWPGYARLVRGQVLAEKERLYVEAARALGISKYRIMFNHILPNVIAPLFVVATLDLGGVILVTSALSFIGFGAQAGDAELGRMIADSQEYLSSYPHMVFFPGLTILIIVLGFNLLGDGLRDVLDPRLRR